MKYKILSWCLGILVVFFLGLAALWYARLDLLTRAAIRTLDRQGLGPASFRLDRADLKGLHLTDLHLRNGTIRAKAVTLTFVPPGIDILLGDLSADLPGASLGAVNGRVRLSRLRPPATPSGQVLTGEIRAGPLPPARFTLGYQLRNGPVLAVERLEMDFAGGKLTASPFAVDPHRPAVATTLSVDKVELALLFKIIGIDGLDGSGRLSGQIPLRLENGKVRVEAGQVAGTEPGILHVKAGTLPAQIAAAGGDVAQAVRSLEDFHYSVLTAGLEEKPSGEGAVLLHLEGNNPAVLAGRPFRFNIKLESNFDRLTDIARQSMTATQELLRRAERNPTP